MSTQLRLGETPTPGPLGPRVIRFEVHGTPRPQGSTRAFIPKGWSRPIITTDNEKLKPWRQEIAGTAAALDVEIFKAHTPLSITLRFYFARPASVSPRKRPGMTVKPDGDKLLRAVLDALTGILYPDDAQVVRFAIEKLYGSPERVEIELQEAV
jgi:crossover junction endodeoxyribonuclease RusA